jgi:hypothetical protein
VEVLLSFAVKEKRTKKETGRLHPGLLKFVLWLCLCFPAMPMPEWLGYVGFIRLCLIIDYSSPSLRGTKQSLNFSGQYA